MALTLLLLSTASLLERSLLAARSCSLAFVPPSAMASEPYYAGMRVVAQVEEPGLSGATIFESKSTGEMIIACRGSASFKNFRTNLDIGPVPLTIGGAAAPADARVHKGFQQASQQLWKQLEPYLPAFDLEQPILLTGHSLGGGTATLLGLHLAAAGRQAELITIAGPRLGNGAFASHVRGTCLPAMHLVHGNDAVVKSNAKLWDDLGFEHVGTVVPCAQSQPCLYLNDKERRLAVSDAMDPSQMSLKGVLVDHCQYLGVYIGVRLEHPSVWLRSPF